MSLSPWTGEEKQFEKDLSAVVDQVLGGCPTFPIRAHRVSAASLTFQSDRSHMVHPRACVEYSIKSGFLHVCLLSFMPSFLFCFL